MTKKLEKMIQSISDYLSCPIACALDPKDNKFHFCAFLKGRPQNLVEFASKGQITTFEKDGYNACIEIDENGKESYHRIDLCNNVYILPFIADTLEEKIFEPTATE